ncbi:glutathione S-transferase family protein [Brevundimonas bacteroides]|uniref:glutathione S-transferase family protein n=1 Tax=Brevundimonas bacteroides TaxID=74311 RepID=UPI0004953FC8|nr:glutathione S-transferase [Brevundimonas bacteroides]
MLTLFHAAQTRSSRILWLIEELGADVEVVHCEIAWRNGQKVGEADPKNPHPDGKVPALIHDGSLITESAAVALYLTDLHTQAGLGAPVGSPERGALLTWLTWAAGELEPALFARMGGASDPYSDARYEAAMDRLMEALWNGPFLMGARFTVADVMIGSTLAWVRLMLPDSPLFSRYLERLVARPANARARARDSAVALEQAA